MSFQNSLQNNNTLLSSQFPTHSPRHGQMHSNPPHRTEDGLPPLPLDPRPGRYRHYKGNEYRVLGLARHSETLEVVVVYQPLYGTPGLWVRPQKMFIETVEINGRTMQRFERVSDI
jgi:hypothetical protein